MRGDFEATVETPPFGLKGWHTPQYFNKQDIPAEPRFVLLFNADVQAEAAEKFIWFLNHDGEKIQWRMNLFSNACPKAFRARG